MKIDKKRSLFLTILLALVISGCASTIPRERQPEPVIQRDRAMQLFLEGKNAESKGEYEAAIVSYIEALQYDPKSEEIALSTATALIRVGKLRSAQFYTDVATRINPENPDSWHLLVNLEEHAGRIDKAATALENYLRLVPDTDYNQYLRLAYFYALLDRNREVRNYLMGLARDKNRTIEEIAQTADILMRTDNIREGLSLYRKLAADNPEDPDIWFELARVLQDLGRFEEAVGELKKGLELNPGNPLLMVTLGNIALERNDWKEAIAMFEGVSVEGATQLRIKKTLAQIYFYDGRDYDALAIIDSLKATGDDDAVLYFFAGKAMNHLGRYNEAASYFEDGFDKGVDDLEEGFIYSAAHMYSTALVKLDRFEEAIEIVRNDISQFITDDIRTKVLEASVYSSAKRFDDAIAIYEWLTGVDPENVSYLLSLGYNYMEAGRYSESEKALMKAKSVDPKNLGYLFHLSFLYEKKGERLKAEDTLMAVLKIEPDNDLALNNLAYLWIESDKNLNKALKMVRRALEFQPTNGAYLDTMGWGYYKRGDYKRARDYIEKALKWEATSDRGVIYDHYGDILIKLGSREEAVKAWRKAIELGEDEKFIMPKIEKNMR